MNEDTTNNVETTQAPETQDTAKTYTEEEVQALLQKEGDRRVTQALQKQQQKFEKQLSLSKLDDNEREKAEKDDLIAELKEELAGYKMEARRSEIKNVLSTRGLSVEFADCLKITEDVAESQAVIEKFDKLFKQAVNQAVEKRLGGSTPKSSVAVEKLTQDDLHKLSYNELLALKQSDPDLYKQLINN